MRGLNTKWRTFVFFLAPTKPLQSYGQASATGDTVLVMIREMTGMTQAVVAGGRRGKDDRKQNTQAPGRFKRQPKSMVFFNYFLFHVKSTVFLMVLNYVFREHSGI